jgi:hypothetical protein
MYRRRKGLFPGRDGRARPAHQRQKKKPLIPSLKTIITLILIFSALHACQCFSQANPPVKRSALEHSTSETKKEHNK